MLKRYPVRLNESGISPKQKKIGPASGGDDRMKKGDIGRIGCLMSVLTDACSRKALGRESDER